MLSLHERREQEQQNTNALVPFETPIEQVDFLSLRYPAYKDRIVKARAAGYTDDEILPRLQEREAKALLYYPADQVNERIGRTKESMDFVSRYERSRQRDAYVKAYEGKLTEQDIDERLVAAELIHVQAPLLLRDDELYKKLAGHIKMREGLFEAAYNGAVRDRLNKDESSLGMRLIYGEESEGLWKQLDELEGLQQQYMPARDPSFSGSVKRGVGGAVEVLAQYVKGAYRGATVYGPTMAAAAGSAAAVMNAPAFTNPITAPGGLAATGSAMVAGFGTGMALGAGMENFEREAGGAMVEYCRMKDEQGCPMDRNAARVAAVLAGAVNAGLEHFQMSTFLKNVPGGDRLVQFFSRSGMKKLLAIPTVRSALAEIGKRYIGGIATESIQEMAQETVTILGGELGKILSGQEFAGLDLEESIDRVLETGAQTVGTMAVSFLPGAAMNTVSGVRQARAIQKGVEQTAASLGISTDELMARVNAPDEPAQGRAVDGLGENPQPSGPAMKDGVQLGPTREAAARLEAQTQEEESQTQGQTQVQSRAVDGLGKNGVEEDTNVYLPAQAIESYNQENPGLLEDLGIVVEPVEGTSEVRLTAEQYEALEDVAPELAEAVKNDVRRGSKGMTTREVGETLKKKAEKPAWRTAEVDGITRELEQEALSAGLDKAEARQWSKMAGSFIGVTSKRYNVAPSELARMKLRQGTEEMQGESFGQPVNPGVNLGQKVPILDLSGKIPDAQRATPQELLDFLKAEFVGKEPSISADGEAMIGLPSNSAAKHVVRSSWKGLTYEDMDTRTAGLMSLRDVLQNATLIESSPNQKSSKTHLKNIHRFYIPVWSSDGLKTLRIVAHESKNSDGRTPVEVDLNDLIVERQKEGPARLSGTPLSGVLPERQLRGASEVTIADMLRGVKDAEGKPYVGEEYQQSAYHGTPHRGITKMSLQHVGTGEGNQVYGYGIYSAEARDTADFYRKTLIGKTLVDFDPKEYVAFTTEDGGYKFKDGAWIGADGGKVTSAGERVLSGLARGRFYSSMSLAEDIARYRKINAEDIAGMESHASELREELAQLENEGKAGSFQHRQTADELEGVLREMAPLQEELDWLDANPLTGEEITQPDAGQVYRLEVPENDVLLDRDAPLSKQPKKVKTAIRKIAKGLSPEALANLGGDISLLTDPESTGGEFYRTLASLSGIDNEKSASMLLLKHGIPGLRYLDGMSRGAGEGTHNFVIWDEDAMSIMETYYQIIGRRGAEALDAAEEGTARLDNLNVAREMEQSGKDARAIRLATGWERGVDGKWRYEIPDGTFRREGLITNPDLLEFRELERKFIDGDITEEEQARLKELTPVVRQIGKPSRLADFYDSPELYAAYPELADIRVEFQGMEREKKGAYSLAQNTITLNAGLRSEDARTALVHEIQHAIQNIEGFASGGNLDGGGEQYHRLAGETEARNAARRAFLADKERRERLLTETEDVAREDQIILKGMMEAYSAQQPEIAENIRRGQAAMEKVITEQTDVMDAMHRDDLGSISFLWGEPGRGPKFKGGAGVSHIIAHRNAQGYDGEAVARKMVEVIARGEVINRRGPAGGERVDIVHDGYTAVLSLYKDGERQTWLLSGWEDYKKEAPDVSSEGDGSTGTTLHGPMRARPEEGAGALDNSKPPLPQKGKGEPAPNARLTVRPDGVSLIEFFKNANRSTSFHELAHHMFRVIYELSGRDGVDPQLIEDVDTILREAGVTREEFEANTDGARTKAHEFFARGFEVYISEGKAPSKGLRGVFRRLRAWMIEVYHDVVQALGIELSDEMRGVYDRLLAMPEEIDAETTIRELAVEEAALKEEIQRHEAEMREREAQKRISAEGGEEWATLEIPEDTTEAVDGWLSELESYEIGHAARAEVRKTLDYIREEGGLNFERLAFLMGDEAAGELRKKLGNFYFTSRKALSEGRGLPLDVLAGALGLDENGLVAFLEGIEGGKLKKPAPLLEVNTDTLNALVDRLGIEGARSYLKDRARYLTKQQRAIQQEYDRDKNNAQVRADLEATYREQREIADGLRALEGTLKAEADIASEVSIEPVVLTPESGRSIDEADDSELLLTADGSTELGRIDEDVAKAAGIAAGEIRANVGAVRHAEKAHGAQILDAGYPDVQTFILDSLAEFNEVRRGSGDSLLLIRRGDEKEHPTVAVELINEDGVYRVKTAWIAREKYVEKKKLLATRSATPVNGPASVLASGSGGQEVQGDSRRWSARQTSNSVESIASAGRDGNPEATLTLSEAMRRGYAMAEKYARAAFKAGREAEAEKLTEFKEKSAERLAGFKERAAGKLDRVKEEAAGKLDELEVKRRLQLGSERAKAAMKRAELKKEAAERVKDERAKARERMQLLKQKLQERQKLKEEVNKLVKGINNMAKSESISWARHKELEKLLADYDLKKRKQKTLDRRAELEEYLKENPEAADTMNAADLKYLGTRTLNDMTLDDLRTLNEQVQQIYDRGHEEYKVWDLERTERRDTIHSELVAVLKKRKTNLPKIVTKAEDIKKQYKGVRGKLEKAKDWTYAATLGPDRFFDWLDKGATDYTGAFVRYLVDEVNKQRDVALRHIFERRKWMEDRLKPLGFRMSDFTRIAATVEGQDFTWDDIMEIYIGMRNDKKGRAILYGNLKNVSDPEGTAAYLIGLLTEDHKKAAELVVEDHNRNVDRIEAGLIDAFQKGMDRETDYTSIHRLEHLSSMGLIDAESAEALTDGMSDAGVLRRVEDGFMKKRVEIKDENQTPIKLGLFSNWHEDVSRHEHTAAMAATARDTAGALLMRSPADGKIIGKMVKERFGDEAWRTLVDFVNTNVMDDARLAHTLLDGMSNTMMKNMAIAYLAGNLGTVLKQTTSIPRFLITAGPHRILVSIAQFLTQGPKFLEKVYELDPQMRDRAGSPILTMLRQDPRWGRRMYQRGLSWMLAPISMMDRWVAAIGWKATYDANLRRLGHEGAVREAQRAVRLTQQPASAKDAARMWRQNGFVRLAMVFTSDAAQTFGMTAYDLVQQLRSGKLGRAFSTLTALALTGILMKAASEGLPSDEDDEDEDRSWVLEAFTEQFISSIPLVGKEAMVLYDNLSGKRRGTQYSAFITPVEKAARAWRLWRGEDSDEEDFRRATWLALEAFSLSRVAPIPATGIRRMAQSMELAEEDGMAAALNMVGIRRRE